MDGRAAKGNLASKACEDQWAQLESRVPVVNLALLEVRVARGWMVNQARMAKLVRLDPPENKVFPGPPVHQVVQVWMGASALGEKPASLG